MNYKTKKLKNVHKYLVFDRQLGGFRVTEQQFWWDKPELSDECELCFLSKSYTDCVQIAKLLGYRIV